MVDVSRATRAEYPAACRALFAPLPPEVAALRADRVLRMIAGGDIDPDGLLVARRRGQVVGAVLIQFHPGRAAVVSPPGADDPAVADGLADCVVSRLRDLGVRQAQSVVPPAERDRAGPLERVGFRAITQLIFLCRPTANPPPFDSRTSPLTITPITDPDPRFARILEATYEGTLDCPELDGTRSIEEVLACYRFTARGAPDWLLASSANEPVGVVMFAPGPQPEIRELSYLGLVRSARGRGLGRELLRYAINHANGSGAGWLTLSVDERNAPALALYRGQSFREFDRQAVFFWEP